MTDARLRDLERRSRETGSVEDEAAYLLERVRAGTLTRERLELAAYCGHDGARRALGDTKATRIGVKRWAVGLRRWGREASTRGAIAAARAATAATHEIWSHKRIEQAIARAEEWVRCQCNVHAQAAREAADQACEAALEAPPGSARQAATAGIAAAREIEFFEGPKHTSPWGEVESVGVGCVTSAAETLTSLGVKAAEEEIRDCIGRDLSAWALGLRDSVAERAGQPSGASNSR